MPQPLSFDHLQAILRQPTAGLPDVRKPSPNTRYTIQNAALGAFGIFFGLQTAFEKNGHALSPCREPPQGGMSLRPTWIGLP